MNISQTGVNLVKEFEGFRGTAYQDSVGVWTIGYGHTSGVKKGQTITQEQATKLLADELNKFAAGVAKLITKPVNQNQFDALVSFAYNVGLGNLKNSDLLKDVNAGNFTAAASEFPKWHHAGGKDLPGLIRRRAAEKELFEKPVTKPAVKVAVAKKPTTPATYKVSPGDTLSEISAKYHTTVSALEKLNHIPNANKIHVGQVLKLR